MRRPAPEIAARSLLATAETVGFATFVHTRLGGHLPHATQIAALAVVVLIGSVAVLAGRVRLWVVAPVLIAAQIALHEGFTRFAGESHPAGAHDAMPGMAMPPAPDAAASMLFAHVLIGLVAFLVLVCQEQAFAALTDLVQVLRADLVATFHGPAAQPTSRRTLRPSIKLVSTAPRRGPPRSLLLTP